ncbi:MAG: hypothetical protein A6F71_02925 [Cycloclasticus sp. symbiont of Poecilosclerida sp. M]|nr:MAG: hypothetical protein A6F71_02925 [Cycloclasticus sp. symbiont of Poecilosclerida sp. M]
MFKHPINSRSNSLDGLKSIHLNLNSQRQLTKQVKEILSPQLALHCLHAIHTNDKIVLFTDSSAWASKLLFMRRTILKNLSALTKRPIKNFNVKVLPKTSIQTKHKLRHTKRASKQTIINLNQPYNLDRNDVLSIALKKLADTL